MITKEFPDGEQVKERTPTSVGKITLYQRAG
jgi:hypothetical protein